MLADGGSVREFGDLKDLPESTLQGPHHLVVDAVVNPRTATLAVDEADGMQLLEVMADRGLRPTKYVDQITGAHLAVGLGRDQRHQTDPDRIGQGLEEPSKIARSRLVDRRLGSWFAARCIHRWHLSASTT